MLQLREVRSFRQRLLTTQAKQHTTSSDNHVESVEGPSTTVWLCQLYHMEEIPTGEKELAVTFCLNKRPTVILFDSRASYDFMSYTCAKRAKLSIAPSGAPCVISTLGGRVDVDCIAQTVLLELSGRVFSTSHVILSGQGIDVILGMSWMKMHKAVLDIAARLVYLNSPVYGKATLNLPMISRIKTSLYHLVERKLEEIHVV
jgi:hypothetical protein